MPSNQGHFVMDDSYYLGSHYQIPAYNHHHMEPQLLPSNYIHPDSAAGQLGLTPAEMAPILRQQQEFLRDELAQPPPALTRPTTTYHLKPQIKTQPDPAFYACPQQEAANLGISLWELAAISEEAVREQAEWLASDEANWRKREGERWRSEATADRGNGEQESRGRTEEAERQEQRERETMQEQTTTTAHPRSAPRPPYT
jgi:hypothetical protein